MEGTLIVQDRTATESVECHLSPACEAICSNCNCWQDESVRETSDELVSSEVRLWVCTDCQMILANRRQTEQLIGDSVWASDAFDLFQITGCRRWRWLERLVLRSRFGYQPKPVSLFTRLLSHLAVWKFHSHLHQRDWIPFRVPGRLLNIGRRNATYLERMRSFGWTVTEIDPATHTDVHSEQKSGATITDGAGLQQGMAPESFDAVTLWHVVQQHSNPRRLLRSAAQLLRPGGLMVIEVPNIESLTFSEFGEHWPGLNRARYHFSSKSVRNTLPSDLLRIVEMQQIGIDSWIQEAARRAVAAGRTCYQTWLKHGKWFWNDMALRSEIANQADGLRIIAERRS